MFVPVVLDRKFVAVSFYSDDSNGFDISTVAERTADAEGRSSCALGPGKQ